MSFGLDNALWNWVTAFNRANHDGEQSDLRAGDHADRPGATNGKSAHVYPRGYVARGLDGLLIQGFDHPMKRLVRSIAPMSLRH